MSQARGTLLALLLTAGIAKGRRYDHWRDRQTAAEWVRRGRREQPSA